MNDTKYNFIEWSDVEDYVMVDVLLSCEKIA
jgi:hypothetical protein